MSLIHLENVSKKYCSSARRALPYAAEDIIREAFGAQRQASLRRDEFWTLREVDLQVNRGDCIGIIGPNGAGKSTLLKLISGLILPDIGTVKVAGKVGALLELGAGFHPQLTGRENIYLNGSILGMSKQYIARYFDEIVDFAEIGRFIDMPVKHYSSGMYLRLGFAIATKLKADVLLLDEVLAVGDVHFQAKCFNAINSLKKESAVVFVSHSMAQISRLCNKVALVREGELWFYDSPAAAISEFRRPVGNRTPLITGSGGVELRELSINDIHSPIVNVKVFQRLSLELVVDLMAPIESIDCVVSFIAPSGDIAMQCNSYFSESTFLVRGKSTIKVKLCLDEVVLNPDNYSISVGLMEGKHGRVLRRIDNIAELVVSGGFYGYSNVQLKGRWDVS